MKYCNVCKKETPHGPQGVCRPCDAKRAKAYREANREKVRKKDRERYASLPLDKKAERIKKLNDWNKNNPEKRKAYVEKYLKENADRLRERNKEWVKNNPDRQRQRTAKYHAENPHKACARSRVRRGAMRNRKPMWANDAAIAAIYLQAKEFRDAGIDCEVDHIYPLQGEFVSGLHCEANLQIISSFENRSKQNKFTPV